MRINRTINLKVTVEKTVKKIIYIITVDYSSLYYQYEMISSSVETYQQSMQDDPFCVQFYHISGQLSILSHFLTYAQACHL